MPCKFAFHMLRKNGGCTDLRFCCKAETDRVRTLPFVKEEIDNDAGTVFSIVVATIGKFS